MEMNSDTYELICDQLKHCLLPELDREIGNEPLERDDFGIFRYGLEKNLQLLFDIIAKNERLVRESFDNNDNTFRTHFILLLHQQTGHDETPFQVGNESISRQIRFLIEKYYKQLISMPEIHNECLEYYKKRLTADKWKRNVGAVYGYLQMYKVFQCFYIEFSFFLVFFSFFFVRNSIVLIFALYSYISSSSELN